MKPAKYDLTGSRFTRLLVLHRTPSTGSRGATWACVCDCGSQVIRTSQTLRTGNTRSCGCLRDDQRAALRESLRGPGWTADGKKTPTYRVWHNMKTRCLNPKNDNYPKYGGRGITICQQWIDSFERFLADMGERPAGKTLDRRDNDGNYEPSNCRWVSRATQGRNTRSVRLLKPVRDEITSRAAVGQSALQIAAALELSATAVKSFLTGKTWANADEELSL